MPLRLAFPCAGKRWVCADLPQREAKSRAVALNGSLYGVGQPIVASRNIMTMNPPSKLKVASDCSPWLCVSGITSSLIT